MTEPPRATLRFSLSELIVMIVMCMLGLIVLMPCLTYIFPSIANFEIPAVIIVILFTLGGGLIGSLRKPRTRI